MFMHRPAGMKVRYCREQDVSPRSLWPRPSRRPRFRGNVSFPLMPPTGSSWIAVTLASLSVVRAARSPSPVTAQRGEREPRPGRPDAAGTGGRVRGWPGRRQAGCLKTPAIRARDGSQPGIIQRSPDLQQTAMLGSVAVELADAVPGRRSGGADARRVRALSRSHAERRGRSGRTRALPPIWAATRLAEPTCRVAQIWPIWASSRPVRSALNPRSSGSCVACGHPACGTAVGDIWTAACLSGYTCSSNALGPLRGSARRGEAAPVVWIVGGLRRPAALVCTCRADMAMPREATVPEVTDACRVIGDSGER
jgi:hypothetical protein